MLIINKANITKVYAHLQNYSKIKTRARVLTADSSCQVVAHMYR